MEAVSRRRIAVLVVVVVVAVIVAAAIAERQDDPEGPVRQALPSDHHGTLTRPSATPAADRRFSW
jgi:hypothetical protein